MALKASLRSFLPGLRRDADEVLWIARRHFAYRNMPLVAPKSIPDQILQCISKNDEVCVLSVTATDVLREAQCRHKTSKTATAVLGRALLATLLLNVIEASAETIQVTIIANGLLGLTTTIGSGGGLVKGFVDRPTVEVPFRDGRPDGELAIGKTGSLSVILKNKAWKKWKVRTVRIYKGEVAEGIGRYLIKARELNTIASFGVSFDQEGDISCARGYIFQALEDVSKSTLKQMEENIKTLPSMSHNTDLDARMIAERLLDNIGVGEFIDMPTPRFGPCGAEVKEQFRKTKIGEKMPFYEIRQNLREKGFVEINCCSCGETYRYTADELQEYIGQGVSDSEEEC